MRCSRANLQRVSPLPKTQNKLFPNVNVDEILSGKPVHTSYQPVLSHTHTSNTDYSAPSAFDLKAFHQQFQARLTSDADILTFYNQLKSQGKKYHIYLRDLNDIGPESDVCPDGVDSKAREDMALAIYQKLQSENTRDFTY